MKNNSFNPIKLPYKGHRVYDIPGLRKYGYLIQDMYSFLIYKFKLAPEYDPKDDCFAVVVSMKDLKSIYYLPVSAINKLLNKLQKIGYINKKSLKGGAKMIIKLPKLTPYVKAFLKKINK